MKDTIAAISTATGEAGIGIVRMSGSEAIEIANNVFKGIKDNKLIDGKNRTLQYGHILDEDTILDEVLVAFMKAPHTYTREDIVEIYCHGGIISVRKILELLLKKGARLAENGEFTKRAFLNGRLDLSQAEAVIDMIKAKSEKAYEVSLSQLEGSLSGSVKSLREAVLEMMAIIVANIDFPEEDIEIASYTDLIEKSRDIITKLRELIDNSNRGKLIREGINTVILGKPNVGKSSLLNALLRDNKAIVTDIPGTTRDTIEDFLNLDGIYLKLTDTAGIRETSDEVEKIGVDRAKERVENADLIIGVFDTSLPFDSNDLEIAEIIKGKKSIILLNKSDLDSQVSEDDIVKLLGNQKYIRTSILLKEGVKTLEDSIKDLFFQGEIIDTSQTYVTNLRHINALKTALESMISVKEDLESGVVLDCVEVDLNNALDALGEITGETVGEDILDKIFSEFCIGK